MPLRFGSARGGPAADRAGPAVCCRDRMNNATPRIAMAASRSAGIVQRFSVSRSTTRLPVGVAVAALVASAVGVVPASVVGAAVAPAVAPTVGPAVAPAGAAPGIGITRTVWLLCATLPRSSRAWAVTT